MEASAPAPRGLSPAGELIVHNGKLQGTRRPLGNPVTFVGRAIDNHDGGAGNDKLFISVSDGSNIVMQIGNSAADPATIATGNLQIHTTSCN